MTWSRTGLSLLAALTAIVLLAACSGAGSVLPQQSDGNPGLQPAAAQASTPAASPTVATPAPGITTPAGTPSPGYGPGIGPGYGRGPGYGPGMGPGMGPGRAPTGPGFGPGYGAGAPPYNQNGAPVSMDQAVQIANQYLSATGYTNLVTSEVHEFANGLEAEYAEKDTGAHAFQVLIDKYSGQAYPEMGPNMMWNTKYSPMGGMMGAPGVAATTNMPVSAATARSNAQQWLNANFAGATLESDVDTAYGYYEFMVDTAGKPYGEIDVNGYTGQVWYENWHGPLVQTRELTPSGQ